MLEQNSIQENVLNKITKMYDELIFKFRSKNDAIVIQNQVFKKKITELETKINLLEKRKNQNLTRVPQGSGHYYQLFQTDYKGKKKQEFKQLNEKEQTKKLDIQSSEFHQNQETEKKQKKIKELEKTPPKSNFQQKILQVDDQQQNGLDIQFKNTQNKNKNQDELKLIDEQKSINQKVNPTQNKQQEQQIDLEQNDDLNYQNKEDSQFQQQQQPLDHNIQLKNELPKEIKQKCLLILNSIQELKNQNLQNNKKIYELTQQLSQFQKTFSNSNDTTMIIEHIEENQKEQIKNGHIQHELNINQNDEQIDELQKQELQNELNEERRKNKDLIKSQQMFLQELRKIYKQSKIMNLLMKSESENEDEDDQEKEINQSQFLKEWKKNLSQLADEIGEYEENERNLKQQLNNLQELKTKYDDLTMYYTEAYNRLSGALQKIDELNQEIENKNSLLQEQNQQIMQSEQRTSNDQNYTDQFQENSQNYFQYEQEILQLNQTIQQLQGQLDQIQQQDYYQKMNQILQENDELKKINSENLEDSQKKDQLIEDLQQQLLTQSQLISNQDLQEKKIRQDVYLSDDKKQELQQQDDLIQ